MSNRRLHSAMGRFAALLETQVQTDGELLDRYIQQKDEAAFAALVRRRGGRLYSASAVAFSATNTMRRTLSRRRSSTCHVRPRPCGPVVEWGTGFMGRIPHCPRLIFRNPLIVAMEFG
jgi:hypothetical protein